MCHDVNVIFEVVWFGHDVTNCVTIIIAVFCSVVLVRLDIVD
jgi:hypothetical protein